MREKWGTQVGPSCHSLSVYPGQFIIDICSHDICTVLTLLVCCHEPIPSLRVKMCVAPLENVVLTDGSTFQSALVMQN